MKELNADGVSLKGCTYIYAPRGQAGEYAPLAAKGLSRDKRAIWAMRMW
jgi:hypothetical protein